MDTCLLRKPWASCCIAWRSILTSHRISSFIVWEKRTAKFNWKWSISIYLNFSGSGRLLFRRNNHTIYIIYRRNFTSSRIIVEIPNAHWCCIFKRYFIERRKQLCRKFMSQFHSSLISRKLPSNVNYLSCVNLFTFVSKFNLFCYKKIYVREYEKKRNGNLITDCIDSFFID